MSEKYTKHFDTLWKIGMVALLVADLYLSKNYIRKEEYEKDKEKSGAVLQKINDNISSLNINLAVISSEIKDLDDIKKRIITKEGK